jgi:hypothetical protein
MTEAQREIDPLSAPAAVEAPEPQTADERMAEERERGNRRRSIGLAALLLLGYIALHSAGHLPGLGRWGAIAIAIVWVGLSLWLSLRRPARKEMTVSPLRGFFLVSLAIGVLLLVLVSLDSFSGENLLLLAVVWGIVLALWLADRGLVRLLRVR